MTRPLTCSAGLLRALRAAQADYAVPTRPLCTRAFNSYNETSRQRTSSAPYARVQQCIARAPSATRAQSVQGFQCRSFSSSSARRYKTVEEAKSRARAGPFSWRAGVLFLLTGGVMIVYFRSEKARLERQRIAEQTKGIGKPKVGGSFDLVDQDGKPFTSDDMKGKYALIYFGFTHCPDICPEELDKMAAMYDYVKAGVGKKIRPIFISCDPARDTPAVVKTYLKEFHEEFIGLTGTYDNVKDTCKAYRVYFSTPPHLKPGQDYLVDHSIYFYLMDPEGDFVEALGRTHSAEEAAKIIANHVQDWKGRLDTS